MAVLEAKLVGSDRPQLIGRGTLVSISTLPDVRVHPHGSSEAGILANAYLVESANGVVAVDATLTHSESRALRARVEALGKPLLAVLITHAHPDHVAGLTELVEMADTPILALASVAALMQSTEAAKHAQWKPVFQDDWIDRWTYPTQLVRDRQAVTFDGVAYRVYDLGPGGDCAANGIWVMETTPAAAFVGDLVFNDTHVYTADDHILAWLTNLEIARRLLADIPTLYPGHGSPGSLDLLDAQRDYLLAYCVTVKELAAGQPALTEEAKERLVERMETVRPGAGLAFMISLGADAVAAELAGAR
jgi:glyoxylase-like metal-dependent hydrolase (beta-lactamase superfamily II)